MAIQFPNFLSVPVRTPDYSGIADVVSNYYRGKAMPKEDLIKKIQAEFARPLAEQSLLSSTLSNRKSGLDIENTLREMANNQYLEQQLRNAFPGGGSSGGGSSQGFAPPTTNQTPYGDSSGYAYDSRGQNIRASDAEVNAIADKAEAALNQRMQPGGQPAPLGTMPVSTPAPNQINPVLAKVLAQGANQASAQPQEPSQPVAPSASQPIAQTEPNEIVISKGSPQLAGIDMLYENNPLSRAFLEKKGFKKTQDIKFNAKTGQTTIITKYPSGTVTMQSAGGVASQEGIPLTNRMVTKHQNIISSIDNAVPIIQQILKLNEQEKNKKGEMKDKYWEPYPRSTGDHWYTIGLGQLPGWQSQSTKYEALVNSALDSLVGAYGLPSTNEGIETVKKQLIIGHGETDRAYVKRLKDLITDLKRRQSYSANEVKKSNKISPVDTSAGGADTSGGTYSSNDYEVVS